MKKVPDEFSELHCFRDPELNFFAVICLHNRGFDSAIGGTRFITYPSEAHATEDALRLSRAMALKAEASELALNGGKAVILKPAGEFDRAAIFKRFAECVDSLNGRYVTTIDSGTFTEDMAYIKSYTSHVVGYDVNNLHPSASTALGVLKGIQASIKYRYGRDDLNGVHVAIQGVGSVGSRLAKLLHLQGAKLTLCDSDITRARDLAGTLQAEVVPAEAIYEVACDVFSPCGLGRVINPETIAQLKTQLIAGAANNQLSSPDIQKTLTEKNILYIPDHIINAGGLIHLAFESQNHSEKIADAVEKIYERVLRYLNQHI